jgi:hypothetical protein
VTLWSGLLILIAAQGLAHAAPPAGMVGTWDVIHVPVDGQDTIHQTYARDDPRLMAGILVVDGGRVKLDPGDLACQRVPSTPHPITSQALIARGFPRPRVGGRSSRPTPEDFGLEMSPGHGPPRALSRTGGPRRGAHLAGPHPRGRPRSDRCGGHRAQGQDTKKREVLSNDFFVNLLDMATEWKPMSDAQDLFEGRDRKTGALKWTGTRVDLVFGSNAQLRALAEVYGSSDAQERFAQDFVAAWNKVMNVDRCDVA